MANKKKEVIVIDPEAYKGYTELSPIQGTVEWVQGKVGIISASSSNDLIFPAKRREYIWKIAAERATGHRGDTFTPSDAVAWGIEHEQTAREWYERFKGVKVVQTGMLVLNHIEGVACSPDGLVGQDGLIEIKCPGVKNAVKYMVSGPSRQYTYQMQFQMWVTNRAWCDFVVFDPRNKICKATIKRVKRDPEIIARIEAEVLSATNEVNNILSSLKANGVIYNEKT